MAPKFNNYPLQDLKPDLPTSSTHLYCHHHHPPETQLVPSVALVTRFINMNSKPQNADDTNKNIPGDCETESEEDLAGPRKGQLDPIDCGHDDDQDGNEDGKQGGDQGEIQEETRDEKVQRAKENNSKIGWDATKAHIFAEDYIANAAKALLKDIDQRIEEDYVFESGGWTYRLQFYIFENDFDDWKNRHEIYLGTKFIRRTMHHYKGWSSIFHGFTKAATGKPATAETIDTNNYVESWHNVLKMHFFKDRQGRRVDSIIYTLVKSCIPFYQRKLVQSQFQVKKLNPVQRAAADSRIKAEVYIAKYRSRRYPGQFVYTAEDPVIIKVPTFQMDPEANSLMYKIRLDFRRVKDIGEIIHCQCPQFQWSRACCKHIAMVLLGKEPITFCHITAQWDQQDDALVVADLHDTYNDPQMPVVLSEPIEAIDPCADLIRRLQSELRAIVER
ncbi:hypothetical protein BG011_008772 [Mortierella polycephala]|uniref:SWIM-type domain-containing protein n=1 Tax=Mortierella polycephala TaxID=41804 RepID=A0A9P6TX52_9FUNG|nr:hypothetical protein BG011_008772 [Mortierella polycephala]